MNPPKSLWITPKWPFPCRDGARMATVNLVKNLTRLGAQLDLMAIVPTDEDIDPSEATRLLGIRDTFLVRRSADESRVKKLLRWGGSFIRDPQLPLTLSTYASAAVQSQFQEILSTQEWDTVIYDGLHTAATSYTVGNYQRPPQFRRVIYRAHNFETELWDRGAQMTSKGQQIKKLLLQHQGRQVGRFEAALAQASDWVATVSERDATQLKRVAPKTKVSSIPIGIDLEGDSTEMQATADRPLVLLFVGRLDWHPNSHGLQWFLEKVWPVVTKSRIGLQLWVVGSGQTPQLDALLRQSGVRFFGRVDDLRPLYDACSATLVPLFYGSGTRVKVIESCRYGRGCISTQTGVEGLALTANQDYLLCETPQDWILTLNQLSIENCQKLSQRARDYVDQHHSGEKLAQLFLSHWRDTLHP